MEFDEAKLFVGGISRETTENALKVHFQKYGAVLGSTISKDRITNSPRGFGFVRFSDASAAEKALQEKHVILGRTVEVKRAIPRSDHHQQSTQQSWGTSDRTSNNDSSIDQIRTKKVFVGGLSANLSEEEFRKYFERYGRITDVVVMQDNLTHRPRGFGFITFDSEESVENVMLNSFHDLNGRLVEVKRAVPKDGNNGSDGGSNVKIAGRRGSSKSYPPNAIYTMTPGFPPYPYYNGIGASGYGVYSYGSWYPMGGYSWNSYVVPSSAPRSPLYRPMVIGAGGCHFPYANTSILPAYVGDGVGIAAHGICVPNGFMRSGINVKHGEVFGSNGLVPAHLAPRQIDGVKQDSYSSGLI